MSENRWKKLARAWASTPGPQGGRDSLLLSLKGLCMGVADIIPGVSGGTIAFITGIYDQLLLAIKSLDVVALNRLVRLDLAGFLGTFHARFLFFLVLGIGTALISVSRVMNHLMAHYPVEVWSLFFGLIGASILVVGRKIGNIDFSCLVAGLLGTVFSYFLVGAIPVTTPEDLWFVFFCGSLAICAMILPGISGAFILLILGKYEYVTGALRNPFLPENALILAVFICGAAVGIVVFSRFLSWLLANWHSLAISVLSGFMLGAMRKVWPWKEVLESSVIRGKMHVLAERNVLPAGIDSEFYLAVALMIAGAAAVLILDGLNGGSVRHEND